MWAILTLRAHQPLSGFARKLRRYRMGLTEWVNLDTIRERVYELQSKINIYFRRHRTYVCIKVHLTVKGIGTQN